MSIKKKLLRTKYPRSLAAPDYTAVHSKGGNLTGGKGAGEREALGEASENLKAAAFLPLGTYLQHPGQMSGRGWALLGPTPQDRTGEGVAFLQKGLEGFAASQKPSVSGATPSAA